MSVDEIAKPGQTKEEGQINEEEVGIGIDAKGFWHFVIHSKKGVHSVLGFLEMAKDAVKAQYIGQLRAQAAEKQQQSLLRPGNIDSLVSKVKGHFRR